MCVFECTHICTSRYYVTIFFVYQIHAFHVHSPNSCSKRRRQWISLWYVRSVASSFLLGSLFAPPVCSFPCVPCWPCVHSHVFPAGPFLQSLSLPSPPLDVHHPPPPPLLRGPDHLYPLHHLLLALHVRMVSGLHRQEGLGLTPTHPTPAAVSLAPHPCGDPLCTRPSPHPAPGQRLHPL